LGKKSSFTYNTAGRLASQTDRNGDTVSLSYTPSRVGRRFFVARHFHAKTAPPAEIPGAMKPHPKWL